MPVPARVTETKPGDAGACGTLWRRSRIGGGGTYFPRWSSTAWTLLLLKNLGIDPTHSAVRRAVWLVQQHGRWEHAGEPFFTGEVEPCINGMTVARGAYFGQNVDGIVDRLLGEQMADGGWNCEQENGSVRGSFHGTIAVLEGLWEYERAAGHSSAVAAARTRGQEYLLDRGMFRRRSTGDVIDMAWTRFSYPTRYFYDVLRGLDYLRCSAVKPDERVAEAIALLNDKRDADGRWLLENAHPGAVYFDVDEGPGQPSRWNTLRAMRVLKWSDGDT